MTVETKRRALNLSIREDVIADVRRLGIPASRVAEEALARAVVAAREETWLRDNREAVDEHNLRVERDGLLNDAFRRF